MVLILLVAMIGVPILEIIVFIEAGGYLGLWPTVGAVILTAIIGSALLRHQGLSTLARAQENLAAGRLPMTEVFDGLCIVIGGALLLTPGFITDTIGFLLSRSAGSRHLAAMVRPIFRQESGNPHLDRYAVTGRWFRAAGRWSRSSMASSKRSIRRIDDQGPSRPTPSDTQGSSKWRRRQPPPTVVRPDDP